MMKDGRIERLKGEAFEIVIKAYFDSSKQSMLVLWLILWSIAGIGIITQFFIPQPEGFTTYLLVWMAFWAYFEYKVVYAYRWRRFGQERIRIENDTLLISREVSGRALPGKYEVNWIKNLRKREVKENNIVHALSKAYWNPGDERIMFDYKGKSIYFGMELEEKESNNLIKDLNSRLDKLRS